MDLTLVPFGYSVSDGQLVDVHQVASGKQCGCECPSCRAPLIARKGSKKIWHFAHNSKSETRKDIGKCRYSFYVSVRMMARQLIGNQLSIRLPRCEVILTERVPLSTRYVQVNELVTESREIVLSDVCLDADIGSRKVDLSGFVDGYCLAVVFTHPERENFDHFAHLHEKKTGVVAISLTGLTGRFTDHDTHPGSYKKILEDYISVDILSKRWIYHPRLHAAEQHARVRLAKHLADADLLYRKRAANLRSRPEFEDKLSDPIDARTCDGNEQKRYQFNCRLCNSSWSGIGHRQASCQTCGTSLLVSREEISD